MPATLIESHPLVEETRNQVAVKRGPVVYCVESVDQQEVKVADIIIPADIKFEVKPARIENGSVMSLVGRAQRRPADNWRETLYRELNTSLQPVSVTLIPYYAWANRGRSDMAVWLPLKR
ncbi:hypothetical protein MKQ68_10515 [Chitinophaga horti]|uniref:Non-reducing end beta-L-arabinofuranosidase-like GH127 C-terminal domain-containing protein n=1 Tax=Chitinophaga horti TaxID=2920382 RepID=A0ABY6J7B3_9BACT|nr:hypothetical protein [Chitinophaga horti]UYQ95533.1 hypothetical protein MKQ68_10515 [Chitinophaga horti]